MVWPLWNFACGGQRGFFTCDSLQSATYGPTALMMAEMVRHTRAGVRFGEAILVDCAFD